MELLWFYVAVALAISDLIHTQLMWKVMADFYIILAGLIHNTVKSNVTVWIIHELFEAIFHFIVISVLFLSPTIGFLAAFIHFVIDVSHTLLLDNVDMNEAEHRALHFVIESIFFMAIYGV
ncbi:hypothetical protein MBBWO_09650 [Methanobrevibacter woesei]|uniref:Uncharacterized protein n=1 Tax=Methanobrevibacter woesei TaxID=190976 RepID=A0A2U1S7V5_9EURY|nr:hypothetical protein [Methanobrevibacter woesei]MCC9261108.1 hypothetical protein [Methanobrevibacter woesei]PWB86111.1 hypothetical protein MBBWO_09650 [Methanobrevibacter woesei]